MTRSRVLTLAAALAFVAALGSLFLFTRSYAQQPAADVAIDADDIGGVVTGPKGPEAGVWVIAETRDLPVRYIKSVVTDDRGRFVVPDLPAANYQVWARGYGLVDSVKATAKPGQRLSITALLAPDEAIAARYYPAIYWYSMLKIPAADQFGGKSSIPARLTQTQWIAAMKNTGCIGCHQLGQASTRTIPPALGTFATGADAWKRRVQSGQSGAMMFGQLNGLGEMSFANYGDWTDRIAKGELPFAKPQRPQGRRAQHRRHAARLDERQAVPARPHRQRSPLPDGQCLRSALWIAGVQLRRHPDPRPGEERRHRLQGAGARSAHAAQPRPRPCRGARRRRAVALLGQRAHLGDARQQPQLDVRARRPAVAGGVGARRRQPRVLQGRLGSPVGEGLPDGSRRAPHLGVRSQDEEVLVRRHLLLHAPPAVRLRRQRHAVDERRRSRRRLVEHEGVRPHGRRREIAGLDGAGARHQRQRQARRLHRAGPAGGSGQGHARELVVLRRDAEPGRRLDLGRHARHARRGGAPGAWRESAGDGAGRSLHRADAGLRRARRRHRSAGRGVGIARQRPHRQLRSPQVQGAAQRAEGHRRSLPRRLVVPSVSRARASAASARTAPSRATTRGWISTTPSGSATTCRCPPAT